MQMVSLSDEIRDFEDTAAILHLADLLISVDSSPVHLAGAMGRPVWVLLPFVPDWRWLLDRDDTPWYPGMRLLRQPERAAWAPVIARAAADLTQWVAERREVAE
jgi:ADP-heptose:LPS heptosyltransferase